jgi:UDP-glucose 4-epimerase
MTIKSLVTGGCGFIGSHLVESLLNDNHKVVVLDNMSTGRISNLDHILDKTNLTIIKGDILDIEKVKDCMVDCDYVFHLAALADIVPSIVHPFEYFSANVVGTVTLLEAARTIGIKRFIYSASSSCYGIPDKTPTPETSEIKPQYPYAYTKWAGEQAALHWGKIYNLPVVSLRLFNVYGPRARTSGTYGAVFGVFLAQKLAGKPLTIIGDGSQTRDFTYVTDVAKAFLAASKSNLANTILNVGSKNTYSVKYLAELLGGDKIGIPKRPGEPDCTFADTSMIEELLDWKPVVSFEHGVQMMLKNIEYWREAPVWSPESINEATKEWFSLLGQNDV